VCELNALEANCKGPECIECFGNLSFEAFSKDALSDWCHEKQITSKFAVAAVLLSDPILDAIRLQIRRLSKVNLDVGDLKLLLTDEVIKRELIDGDEANSASAFLKKLQRRMNAKRNGPDDDDDAPENSDHAVAPPPSAAVTPIAASGLATDKPKS
jgi:hypothetical protein